VTPVEVNHAVPTFGYIVADGSAAVVIASDTAATDEIWTRARRKKNLKAVFLEATVENAAGWLADLAKHLTPEKFALEVAKLGVPVRWLVVHIHSRRRDKVIPELEALGIPGLEVARFGETYDF
jgi:ribonuclease BN (tRNA processing enzyme)